MSHSYGVQNSLQNQEQNNQNTEVLLNLYFLPRDS